MKTRGYNYLCVSRNKLTDYTLKEEGRAVTVFDNCNRPTLAQVAHQEGGDYYLRVNSPAKAMTERSMNRQWRERFKTELVKARNALTVKGGIKKYDKVVERVGRALVKYPSVSKYYQIDYVRSEEDPERMVNMSWQIKISEEEAEQRLGIYFLRTNFSSDYCHTG